MEKALPYFLIAALCLAFVAVLSVVAFEGADSLGAALEPASYETADGSSLHGLVHVGYPVDTTEAPAPWSGYPIAATSEAAPPDIGKLPGWYIGGRIAVGDPGLTEHALTWLGAHYGAGASTPTTDYVLDIVWGPNVASAEVCAFLVAALPRAPALEAVILERLTACPDRPAHEALAAREALPPRVVVAWLERMQPAGLSRRTLLADTLRESLRQNDHAVLRRTLALFEGAMEEPIDRSAEVAQTHSELLDAARAAVTEPLPPAQSPHRSLEARIRDTGVDLDRILLVEGESSEAMRRGLVRCASTEKVPTERRARCLRILARIERSLAVAVAHRLSSDVALAGFDEVRSLRTYATSDELLAELRELDLVTDEPVVDTVNSSATALGLLYARRRALCLDVRPSNHPDELAQLLVELAHLARPALDGVIFTETPDERAVLRAHTPDGRVFIAHAAYDDAAYDHPALIGFVNGLLQTSGSEIRLVRIEAYARCFVAGPVDAVAAAADIGLWTPIDIHAYDEGYDANQGDGTDHAASAPENRYELQSLPASDDALIDEGAFRE